MLTVAPAAASGRLVANAVELGFLRHRPVLGFFWLGLLAGMMAFSSWATRHTVLCLGTVVEAVRDHLLRTTVSGILSHHAARPGRAGGHVVAQVTAHVETVRDVLAGL